MTPDEQQKSASEPNPTTQSVQGVQPPASQSSTSEPQLTNTDAAKPAAESWGMVQGKKLKDTYEQHLLFVIFAILAVGFGAGMGINHFFKENRAPQDPEIPKFAPLPKDKIRVALIGPISGPFKTFGLSQARGVLGAVMHAGDTLCAQDAQAFSKRFDLVYIDEAPLMADRERLYDEFVRAQETCAVVFGPMSSGSATYLFNDRAVKLKVPTVLTTASSTRMRDHAQYGKLLFQLSANIDDYCGQLVQYLARFSSNPSKAMLCVYTDDEYGKGARTRLQQHATAQNITIKFVTARVTESGAKLVSTNDVAREIESAVGQFTAEQKKALSVVVIAVKTPLREAISIVRHTCPSAIRATTTSVGREDIQSGDFDDVVLLYSFQPVVFSVATMEFYRFAELAQSNLDHLGHDWHLVNTVDAEVHDAALYWFSLNAWSECVKVPIQQKYVTRAAIGGNKQTFGNSAQLFLFRVVDRKMQPIVVDSIN